MSKVKIADIEKLLKDYLGDDLLIVEENVSVATAPGEHYGSVILRVDLKLKSKKNGEEKTLPLVAKLLPSNAMLRVAFDVYVTFKKEVLAYTEAIPALVHFQEECNVSKEKMFSNLFPKCYGARINKDGNNNSVDDDGVLLFENLKVQHFITEDRLKGFGVDDVKLILNDLALFHATPIALKLLKPDVFETKIQPCLVRNKGLEQLPEIGMVFHNAIMEGVRDCPELHPYIDKIQKICDYALDHPLVSRPLPEEPWGTFAHMDFWTSNFLVLKENDRCVKNKIIDLQLTSYDSPLRDLIFFLFTSVVNSILEENFDEFIKIYYEAFINNLKDYENIDLGQFSWDKFKEELNRVAVTEVYHILVMLKPICTERHVVKNTAVDFQDTDWTNKDLLGPNHRRRLKETVLSMVKRNWI